MSSMLNKGCGFVVLMVAGMVVLIFVSMLVPTKNPEPEPDIANKLIKCKFIDLKMDKDRNTMRLFSVVGSEPDFDEFRKLCLRYKSENRHDDHPSFVVLFDEEANAVFPSNPFTAQYGIDENAMRHIKAFYDFNPVNDFSELQTFTENMWLGKSNRQRL